MHDFTEQDLRLIEICKEAGYGWAKYARSVEKQGRINTRQNETLCRMVNRILRQRARAASSGNGRGNHPGDVDPYDPYGMDTVGGHWHGDPING